MFVAGNIETLLEFKEFAAPWNEAKADRASGGGEGEPGKGSLFGAFKGLLNVEFFLE